MPQTTLELLVSVSQEPRVGHHWPVVGVSIAPGTLNLAVRPRQTVVDARACSQMKSWQLGEDEGGGPAPPPAHAGG